MGVSEIHTGLAAHDKSILYPSQYQYVISQTNLADIVFNPALALASMNKHKHNPFGASLCFQNINLLASLSNV